MHAISKKIISTLLALVLALVMLAPASSPVLAAPVTINLCAVAGTATLTGAVSVPIWGFGIPTTPGNCSTATASLPGPQLIVNEGDVVTLNVTNALPGTRTLSFEAPGIAFNAGPIDAASGATVTRTFTASAPGTYIYESSGDSGRQEAMGLYGALIVRPLTPGRAYDTPTTAYDVEAVLLLSQVDPNFNADPDNFNMYNYLAPYWLINGKAYPDAATIHAPVGARVLLRYLNAGHDNTTMMLLGMHEQALARDAHLLNNPFFANAETIPSGGTEDAITTVPAFSPPNANGFPLFNRQYHITNSACPANTVCAPGGMLTFISPSAAVDAPPCRERRHRPDHHPTGIG